VSEEGQMDWQHMNRRDQNIILKRYGFRWQKLDYEDAEEEHIKWFLVGPDGETWSLQRAFEHIEDVRERTEAVHATSVDVDSPVVRDERPDEVLARKHWIDHRWHWQQRGTDGKWILKAPGRQLVTERTFQEAYPPEQ
jgi:hypothetical protein